VLRFKLESAGGNKMNNDELKNMQDNFLTVNLNQKNSKNSQMESTKTLAKEDLVSKGNEFIEVATQAESTESSFYLGLGVLASIFGVSFLFSDSVSFNYKFGFAFGQIVIVGILSLPIFLLWKYFSTAGKNKSSQYSFNFYTAIFLIIWVAYSFARVSMHINQ
jgi:hypothetical protein